ncbi:MAG: tetratricopeptide repeat protein [Chloroflexi bacterium]|nr:tetratricopeptide repeat protein [Chloroflexota bacterium]
MQLFDLLSLFYAFLGVRAVWTLKKNWRAFTDDALTASDRRLASEIAFFVFVPIGVLLHELGHAVATYQVGGTIDWLNGGFHYALFYGYVIPQGNFDPLADWWISLSGNLVSIILGFVPLIFLRFTHKTWMQYTLLVSARIQLGWALVGYPLLTLAGFQGDWLTIYGTLWELTIPLGIAHATLVIALWLFDRSGFVKRWEVSLYAGAADQMQSHDNAIGASPDTMDALLARGNFFLSHDQTDLAIADYTTALKREPENAIALHNLGQIRLMQKRFTDAEKFFRAARARAERDRDLAARVHYGLAMCIYHRGDAQNAVVEFDQAIQRAPDVAEFYYWRGLARRQVRDDLNARNDFQRAIALAGETNPELTARAREMIREP